MSVKSDILSMFDGNPGMRLYVKDIAAELGVSAQTVSSAVSALRRSGVDIQVPLNGVYVLEKQGHGTEPLFRQVGKTKAGVLILEDEEGNLFRATEVE